MSTSREIPIPEARPKHCSRRYQSMAREYATGSPAHSAGVGICHFFVANEKAAGPDGVSVELFKVPLKGDSAPRPRLLEIATGIWMRGRLPQSGEMQLLQGYLTNGARRQRLSLSGSMTTTSVWRYCSKNTVVPGRTDLPST